MRTGGRSGLLRPAFLASLAIALTPLVAQAAVYRLSFEGAVGTVVDDGAFALAGISIVPSDRFDLVAEGSGSGPWNGPAKIGTTVFQTSFEADIQNNGPLGDELFVGRSATPNAGTTGLFTDFISVRLVDPTAAALDSSDFPAALVLNDWGTAVFLISGIYPTGTDPGGAVTGPRFSITGTIDALSYTLIPEPTSAALLTWGIALLACCVRRRNRG